MNQLIKCKACDADMGITAEKCMKCGTPNPKFIAAKNAELAKYQVIGIIFLIFVAIIFFADYMSPYKKCVRVGSEGGVLKKEFVESVCAVKFK